MQPVCLWELYGNSSTIGMEKIFIKTKCIQKNQNYVVLINIFSTLDCGYIFVIFLEIYWLHPKDMDPDEVSVTAKRVNPLLHFWSLIRAPGCRGLCGSLTTVF